MLGSTIRTTSAPRSEVPASASGATSGARHAALPAGSAKTMRTRPGASDVTVIRSGAEGGRRSRRAADDEHHDPEDDADDGEGDPDPAQDHADVAQVAVAGLTLRLRLLALVPEDHGRDAGGQRQVITIPTMPRIRAQVPRPFFSVPGIGPYLVGGIGGGAP